MIDIEEIMRPIMENEGGTPIHIVFQYQRFDLSGFGWKLYRIIKELMRQVVLPDDQIVCNIWANFRIAPFIINDTTLTL